MCYAIKTLFEVIEIEYGLLYLQIKELKSSLHEEEKSTVSVAVKEEITIPESGIDKHNNPSSETSIPSSESKAHLNDVGVGEASSSLFPLELKDGSSDSDSSAISSSGVLQNEQHLLLSPDSSPLKYNCFISSSSPSSSMNCFQYQKSYHVKMEEQNFLSADEACNFFSDEQAPTLQWYCPDQWS